MAETLEDDDDYNFNEINAPCRNGFSSLDYEKMARTQHSTGYREGYQSSYDEAYEKSFNAVFPFILKFLNPLQRLKGQLMFCRENCTNSSAHVKKIIDNHLSQIEDAIKLLNSTKNIAYCSTINYDDITINNAITSLNDPTFLMGLQNILNQLPGDAVLLYKQVYGTIETTLKFLSTL